MKAISLFSIALVFVLSACSSITPAPVIDAPTPVLPTNTLPATENPVAAATDTPQPASRFQSFPGANCCSARMIEAGEYELPSWLGIPLTVEVVEGWGVLNEKAALLFLLAGKGRNEFKDPSQILVFIPIPDGDPQSILNSIRNSPELTPESEITEMTIAGFSGWQFDAAAKPNPEYEGNRDADIPPGVQFLPAVNKYFTPGFSWTTWTAEPDLRFIALNVGEQVLLLQLESPPAEFEDFAGEANKLLQTLNLWR